MLLLQNSHSNIAMELIALQGWVTELGAIHALIVMSTAPNHKRGMDKASQAPWGHFWDSVKRELGE